MAAKKKTTKKTTGPSMVPIIPGNVPDMLALAQDPDLLDNGAWGIHGTGVRVKVVPPGAEYYEYIRQQGQPYRAAAAESGAVPRDVAERIRAEATAMFMLKDWNVTEDGKPVPCTTENAIRYYRDKRYAWFLSFTQEAANTEALFRFEEAQADLKN